MFPPKRLITIFEISFSPFVDFVTISLTFPLNIVTAMSPEFLLFEHPAETITLDKSAPSLNAFEISASLSDTSSASRTPISPESR